MRRLRRLAVMAAAVGAVVAYRNRMLSLNERRYADVLGNPAANPTGGPTTDGQGSASR